MSDALAQFRGKKYMNLMTFRKSGEGLTTTAWFAEEDGVLYVTTLYTVGKAKLAFNADYNFTKGSQTLVEIRVAEGVRDNDLTRPWKPP